MKTTQEMREIMKARGYATPNELKKETGIRGPTIYYGINAGHIKTRKDHGITWVNRKSFNAWNRKRGAILPAGTQPAETQAPAVQPPVSRVTQDKIGQLCAALNGVGVDPGTVLWDALREVLQ